MNKPAVIFYDWDGTLVDSFELIQKAHDFTMGSLHLPLREGDWFRDYFGKQRDMIYASLYPGMESRAQDIFEQFVDAEHTKLLRPMEGAQDLLESAAAMNIPQCVVSNKRARFIHPEVAHLQWGHFFKAVIGAGDAAQDKPSAEPVREAARRAGFPEERLAEAWYVGDTDTDLLCAHNAGCMAFLIHQGAAENLLEKQKYPAKILKNCVKLREYLLQTC